MGGVNNKRGGEVIVPVNIELRWTADEYRKLRAISKAEYRDVDQMLRYMVRMYDFGMVDYEEA